MGPAGSWGAEWTGEGWNLAPSGIRAGGTKLTSRGRQELDLIGGVCREVANLDAGELCPEVLT